MAEAAEQTESMEDILQSIRRIIANEPDSTASAAADDAEEAFELTEIVSEEPAPEPEPETAPAPQMAAAEPAPKSSPVPLLKDDHQEPIKVTTPRVQEVMMDDEPSMPATAPQQVMQEEAAPEDDDTESLLTHEAAEASAHALKNLVNSIPKPKVDSPLMRSGSTLEDLVVESLKPQLSEWLNENLPTIVQNLVEKEIRKILPRD